MWNDIAGRKGKKIKNQYQVKAIATLLLFEYQRLFSWTIVTYAEHLAESLV